MKVGAVAVGGGMGNSERETSLNLQVEEEDDELVGKMSATGDERLDE